MKKSKFTDEQIIGFLKQAEAGVPIKDLCRKGGFSDAKFYEWCAWFGGWTCPMPSSCVSWRRRTTSSSACWPRRIWTSTH